MSNSKGDTKKYTQYTQPRFENVGQRLDLRNDLAAPIEMRAWIRALDLSVHLRACVSELFEMHYLPSRNYIPHSLQKYASLTIVHRYLGKAMWSACWLLRGRKHQSRIYWLKLRDRNSSASVILGTCEMWSYSRRNFVHFVCGSFFGQLVFDTAWNWSGLEARSCRFKIELFVQDSWVAKLGWWRPWSFYKSMLPNLLSWLLMNVDKVPIAASVSSSEQYGWSFVRSACWKKTTLCTPYVQYMYMAGMHQDFNQTPMEGQNGIHTSF